MKEKELLYVSSVCESGRRAIELIKQQKIRNHKLSNSAPEHKGDLVEQELYLF